MAMSSFKQSHDEVCSPTSPQDDCLSSLSVPARANLRPIPSYLIYPPSSLLLGLSLSISSTLA